MRRVDILPQVVMKLPYKELVPGIRLRAVHLENLTVTFVELDEGARLPRHSHPNEQISYIAGGILRMTVSGKDYDLAAGAVLTIPAGAPHSAIVIEGPVFAVDSFSPKREDYVF